MNVGKIEVNIDAIYQSFKDTNKEGFSRVIKIEQETFTETLKQLVSTTTVKAIYVRVFVSRHTVYTEAI